MIWPLSRVRELPIEPSIWNGLVDRLPYLRGFDPADSDRFRALIARFLTRKTISGAHGLEVDDPMRLVIAAQACLPVLHLGLAPYDDFVEIVVHPSAFAVRRQVTDEDGLVHEWDDELAGEAMDRGPVVLSWPDVVGDGDPRTNVVIHEFVHKLDMADGVADGCPPMPARLAVRWRETLDASYDDFVERVAAAEAAIPRHIDPESAAADRYYADLPLDPYAATDEAEFFAVAAEAFFIEPAVIADAFPDLHRRFVEYFGADPLVRLGR